MSDQAQNTVQDTQAVADDELICEACGEVVEPYEGMTLEVCRVRNIVHEFCGFTCLKSWVNKPN